MCTAIEGWVPLKAGQLPKKLPAGHKEFVEKNNEKKRTKQRLCRYVVAFPHTGCGKQT